MMTTQFDPICPVCRRVSLMGIHPACILSSTDLLKLAMDNNPRRRGTLKRPCVTCPFMGTTPKWMLSGFVALNRIRLQKGILQDCHKCQTHYCQGQLRSFSGCLDALVADDLTKQAYKPASTIQESARRYLSATNPEETTEE